MVDEQQPVVTTAIHTESPVSKETADSTQSSTAPTTATNGSVKQLPFDPEQSHPLLSSWTLWYDSQLSQGKKPSATQWGDNIRDVYSVSSVEEFWRLYNNVTLPSQLPLGCSYNWFKKGIEPKWEDPSNEKGGRWTIIINKNKAHLDKMWLWLLLACVGEQLDDDQNQICGAVVNIRKGGDKLCLWTKDAENKDATIKIGQALKKVLELPDNFPAGYQSHFQKARQNKYEV